MKRNSYRRVVFYKEVLSLDTFFCTQEVNLFPCVQTPVYSCREGYGIWILTTARILNTVVQHFITEPQRFTNVRTYIQFIYKHTDCKVCSIFWMVIMLTMYTHNAHNVY